MSETKRKSFFQRIGDHLWLVLILVAVGIVSFSLLANKGSDFTRIASHKTERLVNKRIDRLEQYMQLAMEQPHNQWLELKDFPEDMVIYRYVCDTLQSWNNEFIIDNDDIANKMVFKRLANIKYNIESPLSEVTEEWQFLNLGPEWYLVRKITDGISCQVIAGLEVKNMLDGVRSRNGVNRKLDLSDRFALYPISYAGGAPVYVKGHPLIKIVQEDADVLPLGMTPYVSWIAICLILLGFLLYLYQRKTLKHLLLTISCLIVVIVSFFIMGRRLGATVPVFSPNIYAEGDFFYSLGALLLVNIAIFMIVSCLYMVGPVLLKHLMKRNACRRTSIFALTVLLAVIGILFYIHLTFSSVVMNSSITLELYKISAVDRYTVYVYLSYIALLVTIPMLLQLLRPIARRYLHFNYNVLSRVWRMVFCIICSLYLLMTSTILSSRKEASSVAIWSNAMSIDRDMGFELQLRSIEDYIADDPIVTRLITESDDYDLAISRISENYLGKISQDYDVSLYIYQDNKPDQIVVNFFNERIQNSVPIAENSRFHYSRSANGRSRYTGMFAYYVKDQGVIRILIGIDTKVDKGGRGYSAIMRKSTPGKVSLPVHYSYGKYIDNKLVMYKGEYAYPTILNEKLATFAPDQTTDLKIVEHYVHFINKVADDEVIIISRPKNDYMQYLVSFFLMALLAYSAVSILSIRRHARSQFEKNYYTSRINSVLFLSLLATLVVMAVISVIFVYRRNNANTKSIMTSKINTIQSLVEASSANLDDYGDFGTSKSMIVLRNISNYTRSDLTLYTKGGKAFRSTVPDAFNELVMASRMPQQAYKNIMYRNRRYYIHKETFGDHSFYNMYAPIFNRKGDMLAIVGAPFTDSGIDFMNDAVSHSIFIITLFFILLIVARMLSEKVIDKMFKPLLNMGGKMMSARTGGLEYIIYDREDEISSVVRAYNLMVHDLSESAAQLTVAERDKAWREMARQVAHEIKTPLTPIKLQIQRLQRLREKKNPNWESRFDEILPTIITSIDQLAETANDFSTFAKLYSEEHQVIDLDLQVSEIVSLFDGKENISFEYIGLNNARIMGPKPQLYRVFVNLVTNAIQAIDNALKDHPEQIHHYEGAGWIPEVAEAEDMALAKAEGGDVHPHGYIRVSVRNSNAGDFYDVVFEDNGPGVKDSDRNKLFVPNFTTKSSGSGLGLAISKNILEVCGGKISYSKSFSLQGACFTVRLPKFHPDE